MSRNPGQIITFYSFKGGVGRSMAVANVAATLAHQNKKVLALDFDFEAPGLHRYFLGRPDTQGKRKKPRHAPSRAQRGVIDLFKDLRGRLRERLPADGYDYDAPETRQTLRAIVSELLNSSSYKYEISLRNPNKSKGRSTIDFIAAGKFGARYVERIRTFNWKRFYSEYAEVFSVLVEELTARYDYVLIDARTGFTDVGSICTMVLPDKLVLVFAPNDQSLEGALDVGEQAVRQRAASDDPRPLPLFPLISRLDDSEEVHKRRWVARSRKSFEGLFREAYGLDKCDLRAYFNKARVYHRGYYAYGEHIAAEDEPSDVAGSLAQNYELFTECMCLASATDVPGKPAYEDRIEQDVLKRLGDEVLLQEMIARHPAATQHRAGVAREFTLLDALSRALINRAEALGRIGRPEEAIAALDDLVQRFESSSEPVLQEHAADALNVTGVLLLQEAKRLYARAEPGAASSMLEAAGAKIERARAHAPEDPSVLGNAGYIAFLLGRREEARALLSKAIEHGGETLRRRKLADADVNPLPQDEEFRALILSL